ncbi:MAG: hypothetical protein Q9222_007297 [Ikaeria aurantiellina]
MAYQVTSVATSTHRNDGFTVYHDKEVRTFTEGPNAGNGGRVRSLPSMEPNYRSDSQHHQPFPRFLGNVQRHTRLIIDRHEVFHNVPLNAVPPLQPFHYYPPYQHQVPQALLPQIHQAPVASSVPAFVSPALHWIEPDRSAIHPSPQDPLPFRDLAFNPEEFLAAPHAQAEPVDCQFSKAESLPSETGHAPSSSNSMIFGPLDAYSYDLLPSPQSNEPSTASPIARIQQLSPLSFREWMLPSQQQALDEGSHSASAIGTNTSQPYADNAGPHQAEYTDPAEIVAPAPTMVKSEGDEPSSTVLKLENVACGRVRKVRGTTNKRTALKRKNVNTTRDRYTGNFKKEIFGEEFH